MRVEYKYSQGNKKQGFRKDIQKVKSEYATEIDCTERLEQVCERIESIQTQLSFLERGKKKFWEKVASSGQYGQAVSFKKQAGH